MKRKGLIVAELYSGFCSRVYTLCDAYDLAKRFDKELVILWRRTSDCDCRYDAMFDKKQFADVPVTIIQIDQFHRHLKGMKNPFLIVQELILRGVNQIKYKLVKGYYQSKCTVRKFFEWDKEDSFQLERAATESCSVEAFSGIHHQGQVSTVLFHEQTIKAAKATMAQAGSACIGVHIRRTDHNLAKGSLTESFLAAMKKAIEENAATTFYLATDDWSEQEKLESIFGDRIITQQNKTLSRSSESGMFSALVDCLCLSQTTVIFGSFESKFSRLAAELGEIELRIM